MKKAFTLIELLVVIAIIAILAAILFPVFAQAKAAAKKTQSLSNVKQISLGQMLYIADFDDIFTLRQIVDNNGEGIPPRQTWAPLTWRELSAPYIKNGVNQYTWVTTDGSLGIWSNAGMWESVVRPGAYGVVDMHERLGTGLNYGNWPYNPMSATSLNRPADTLMIVEKGINPNWGSPGRNFEMNWWGYRDPQYSWPPRLKGDPNIMDADNVNWPYWCIPRYRYSANSANVGYADGHAKAVVRGRLNWCREIHIEGMDPGQEWLYQAGNPCEGEAP
ncbi:MAG: prepilin-type N-terminal cleavage/methylation domain-containing protein [Fimbriimonadaceae bacterium]|nr:prepilin-type N-terminal cleavage/methylation domain-containing protein [Fimbriimonadaceae bacterium]